MPKTVKMKRGNIVADVHVDEVENYVFGGWAEHTEDESDGESRTKTSATKVES